MNEKLYVLEFDAVTGEQLKSEYTAEQYAAHDLLLQSVKDRNKAEAKAAADKAAAQAKLETLGLTADDLKALGL